MATDVVLDSTATDVGGCMVTDIVLPVVLSLVEPAALARARVSQGGPSSPLEAAAEMIASQTIIISPARRWSTSSGSRWPVTSRSAVVSSTLCNNSVQLSQPCDLMNVWMCLPRCGSPFLRCWGLTLLTTKCAHSWCSCLSTHCCHGPCSLHTPPTRAGSQSCFCQPLAITGLPWHTQVLELL